MLINHGIISIVLIAFMNEALRYLVVFLKSASNRIYAIFGSLSRKREVDILRQHNRKVLKHILPLPYSHRNMLNIRLQDNNKIVNVFSSKFHDDRYDDDKIL